MILAQQAPSHATAAKTFHSVSKRNGQKTACPATSNQKPREKNPFKNLNPLRILKSKFDKVFYKECRKRMVFCSYFRIFIRAIRKAKGT